MSSSRKILVVDDDEDDRDIFLEIVSELDPSATLITAINGADGLEKLSVNTAPPNIIFLDLNMPIMNGTEFLREIKGVEILRNIPVVILTTSNEKWVIEEVQALGARDFVTKPAKFEDWRAALRRFILN